MQKKFIVPKFTGFSFALLQPQENLSQLFERADQGLYQAKRLGRDRVVLA